MLRAECVTLHRVGRWKLLIEEGLVPEEGCYRDNANALVILLALANVYRDFCMAAFEEESYTVDVAYAAEEVSPTVVPNLAIARLAGELDVDRTASTTSY